MSWEKVQTLLLRPDHGPAVAHLLLRVQRESVASDPLQELRQALREVPLTVGDVHPSAEVRCTLGFSWRGLEALRMPRRYLQVFSLLAPAFAQGAPLRAAQLGDSDDSAPMHWDPAFRLNDAHVLITLHGEREKVAERAAALQDRWSGATPLRCLQVLQGQRLGRPPGEKEGHWVHFRYRDGLVDHCIDGVERSRRSPGRPGAAEPVPHAAGEFLLGRPNDDDFNPFALEKAPARMRALFHDSSFGVLRPMEQHAHRFEAAVRTWQRQARGALGQAIDPDWIRAKLCGRWPAGQLVAPGQLQRPSGALQASDLRPDFRADAEGTGCPMFSHVRRMNARGHAGAKQRSRTLLRRGMPYGTANWDGIDDGGERGLLGLFFCASLEHQFEQFLGQWGIGSPPGGQDGNIASDPFAGHTGDRAAVAVVPLPGSVPPLRLSGFEAWTRTRGTVYTWYPDRDAVERILAEDYLPKDEGPWL